MAPSECGTITTSMLSQWVHSDGAKFTHTSICSIPGFCSYPGYVFKLVGNSLWWREVELSRLAPCYSEYQRGWVIYSRSPSWLKWNHRAPLSSHKAVSRAVYPDLEYPFVTREFQQLKPRGQNGWSSGFSHILSHITNKDAPAKSRGVSSLF